MQRHLVWCSSIICPALRGNHFPHAPVPCTAASLKANDACLLWRCNTPYHDRLAKSQLACFWLSCCHHSFCSGSLVLVFLWTSSHAHNRSSCHSCQTRRVKMTQSVNVALLHNYVHTSVWSTNVTSLFPGSKWTAFWKLFRACSIKVLLFNRRSTLKYIQYIK